MSAMGQSCEHALELELRMAGRGRLAPQEERWLSEHRSQCPSCAAESEALSLLEQDESASPAEPLDDIARRRFIDEVLHKADERSASLADWALRSEDAWPRRARWSVAAVAAAALVIAIASWWVPLRAPAPSVPVADSSIGHGGTPVVAAMGSDAPRVAMLTGDVRVEGRTAVVGGDLGYGKRIETQGGTAIIAVGDGIFLELSASTRASLDRPVYDGLEILLETGAVMASVDPSRRGPKLSVVSPHGRVTVTGTVFSVEVGDDDSFVRVARGKVEIDSADAVGALLPAGRGRAMLSGATRELPFEERASMTRREELFSLLNTSSDTLVDISSVPLGAEVSVDGVMLGATPVVVSLRSGHKDLTLAFDGDTMVRELLDIAPGSKLERVFDLSVDGTAAVVEDTSPRTRTAARRPSLSPPPAQARVAEPAVSAEQLIFEAQALRGARQWRSAAQVYKRLVDEFGETDAAASALVSLGNIELEKLGMPEAALGRFERYLERSGSAGPLAQEALFGKTKALRALGRTAEEELALREFLGRFGRSLYSQEARARLAQLETESK